jgi:hypothetical protein
LNEPVIKFPNGDFTTASYLKNHYYQTGYFGKSKGIRINDYMIIDDKVHQIHQIIVHRFRMGDVEDPDLYAAQPLIEWQNSEVGKWIMEHSVETPMWHRQADVASYGYQYAVEAWLKGSDHTFWQLKWGQKYVDSLVK